MSNVLVTGAGGFIGRHLCRHLIEAGHEVTGLVRPSSRVDDMAQWGVQFLRGDVSDPRCLATVPPGTEIVFHLAGLIKALDLPRLSRVNAAGVRHVAEACSRHDPPPVLVIASSQAAAGPALGDRPRREDDPPAPVSNYGRSKLAGEAEARSFAGQVPTTIVRPPIVFGAGDPASLEIFRPIFHWGIHLVPTWLDRNCSLLHVADLVRALAAAAFQGQRLVPDSDPNARGTYFLASPETLTYAELGRRFAQAAGIRRPWVVRAGTPLPWSIALGCELIARIRRQALYFSWDKAREATAGHWLCSAARAEAELGFSCSASLDERMSETVRGYRELGSL